MSCGYLYEIRRKSDDFEQHFERTSREDSNLSDFSKDEDIWEVPEESFDHFYHEMGNDEEETHLQDDVGILPEVLHLQQFENRKKLHIGLSAEKIALKSANPLSENVPKTARNSFQTINKSLHIEEDRKESMTNDGSTTAIDTNTFNSGYSKVQRKNGQFYNNNNTSSHSLLNFTIVPINVTSQVQKQKEQTAVEHFPEIKLTSFSKKPTFGAHLGKTTNFSGVPGQTLNGLNTLSIDKKLKCSSTTEINKHMTESSTSPESFVDNILSAASSVSIQSSSLSSNDPHVDSDANKLKEDEKACENSMTLSADVSAKNKPGILKTQIPELKIITAPNLLNSRKQANDKEAYLTHSLLTASNSDSFETASNQTRSPSSSPLRNLSSKVPTEDLLHPPDLRCKICNELFKDPRSLNCLHSFCFQCIVNENFKQDASIPFWSQPPQTIQPPSASSPQKQMEELDCKALHSSKKSLRSTSPDIQTVNSYSDLSNVHQQPRRQSSFNFNRKKSSDRLTSRSKTDNMSASLSQQSYQSAPRLQPETYRSITCNICKFPTELPVGGIRQLPQNFLLVRSIEEIRLKAGEEIITKIWCSLCLEQTNAIYHCLTCILNLCTLCKESHERQKSTTKHNIRNIIELRRARKEKEGYFIDNSKFVLKCTMHPGFDIKSFCTVCLQVACSDCLVLLHKGHKHETVPKCVNKYCKLLKDTAEQTKPLCSYAEHSLVKLNDIARNINRRCDEIQAEVEQFMGSYFEAIEAHKTTLLQQVVRARESKVEMILEQQLDVEKRTQDALMALKFSEELTDIASDVEILSFVKILLKRFEYCQQFKAPVDPKISDTLHFLPKIRAPAAKNLNDIPLFGIITMQTVEPALCTLQWDGISQLRLHKKAELVLISRDADGASLCHGGLQIKCHIKYKDNHTKLLPIEVRRNVLKYVVELEKSSNGNISDNRDGSYVITFTPDSQGILILTVTINEKPIKGSPFNLQARTQRPHNGIYHCCAFCSSKGNKNIKCACDGRMPGFNGCGHGHIGHPGRRHWSCCGNVLENSECSVTNKLLNT